MKQDIDTIAEAMETGTDGALFSAIDEAVGLNTPATDSVLARVKAQGVDDFASVIGAEAAGLSMSSNEYKAIKSTVFRAVNFAANLRAGRKG